MTNRPARVNPLHIVPGMALVNSAAAIGRWRAGLRLRLGRRLQWNLAHGALRLQARLGNPGRVEARWSHCRLLRRRLSLHRS